MIIFQKIESNSEYVPNFDMDTDVYSCEYINEQFARIEASDEDQTENTFADDSEVLLTENISVKDRRGIFPATFPTISLIKPVYKCTECDKEFTNKGNLQKHINVHIKPFKCRFCEQSYSRRDYLKRHEYNEHRNQVEGTEEEPLSQGQKQIFLLQCNFCTKVFRAKSLLEIHERKHTGIKPFQCTECSLSFTTVWNLRAHEKKHTGTNNFVCKKCGKNLSTKIALNDHMTVHTGERPHKCEKCGLSFKRTTNAWRHKKKCTGRKDSGKSKDSSDLLDVSIVDSEIFDVNDGIINNFEVVVDSQMHFSE